MVDIARSSDVKKKKKIRRILYGTVGFWSSSSYHGRRVAG